MSNLKERLKERIELSAESGCGDMPCCIDEMEAAIKKIERLTAELKATQDNEQRLVDANKPLLADKYRLQARVDALEAVITQVRSNMNKRAVDNFDYDGGEYPINGDTINMLVLDIAGRDERIAELEATLGRIQIDSDEIIIVAAQTISKYASQALANSEGEK